MATSFYIQPIKQTSSGYEIDASAIVIAGQSSANGTAYKWDATNHKAYITSTDNKTAATLKYLSYVDSSGDTTRTIRYNHSVCVNVSWSGGGDQAVVIARSSPSSSNLPFSEAKWYYKDENNNYVELLGSANSSAGVGTGNTYYVEGIAGSSMYTASDYVSDVTIGGYWKTGYGPLDGGGEGTPKGSYSDPVLWKRRDSDYSLSVQEECNVPISWTKPLTATSSNIYYYVVMGWKGDFGAAWDYTNNVWDYTKGKGTVANITLCGPKAKFVLDRTNWANIDGSRMLYTVHPVFTDKGFVPSLQNAIDICNAYGREDWTIWRKFEDHGLDFIKVRYYNYNNGSPTIMKSTDGTSEFTLIKGKGDLKSFIPYESFPDDKILSHWYKKLRSDSSYNTTTTYLDNTLGTADADTDVAGVFIYPTRTLIFDANGGTCSETQREVNIGSPYGTLPTPTRQYYTFVGWFTDRTGGTQVTSSTTMDNNGTGPVTIYAHWTRDQRKLVFNPNGGTVDPTYKMVDIGSAYGQLPIPVRSDYIFGGWYDDPNAGESVDRNTIMVEGSGDVIIYAHWAPEWDDEIDIEFLCHMRPKIYLSAKRRSLEKNDNVVLCTSPVLEDLPQQSTADDRNFVGSTYKIEHRPEHRDDSSWSTDYNDVIEDQADRRSYSDPEYPTWIDKADNSDITVLTTANGIYRTDVKNKNDKDVWSEFDINQEWQLRLRIYDALKYSSEVTYDLPEGYHSSSDYTAADARTGGYVLYTSSNSKVLYSGDKWCTLSTWSNVALLLKYITKLFVHNPFLDEVLKEKKKADGTPRRPLQTPPETDYWQIREHVQNYKNKESDFTGDNTAKTLYSILKARSDPNSVNGFNTIDNFDIDDYLIPTFSREMENNERLVYDPSQMQRLVKILEAINSNHDKISKEVDAFGSGDGTLPDDVYGYTLIHQPLIVGDTTTAAALDNLTAAPYRPRILELDGERHVANYDSTYANATTPYFGSGSLIVESGSSINRLRDTSFKNVYLYDLERTPESTGNEGKRGTIDHIYNYDVSQVDLGRSLSDFIYLLSRMRQRAADSEGRVSGAPTELSSISGAASALTTLKAKEAAYKATTDPADKKTKFDEWEAAKAAFLAKIVNWYNSESDTGLSDSMFTNWKPSTETWNVAENPFEEYTDYEDYEEIPAGYKVFDRWGNRSNFSNNGCNAACMGLCTNECYSSCVGQCHTACGSSCFTNCTESCALTCINVCSDACESGCGTGCASICEGGCTDACTGSCGGNCTGGCKNGCNTTCKGGCSGGCKTGCTSCTGGCKTGCGSNCNKGCQTTCNSVCRNGCGNSCGDACSTQCHNGCDNNCGTGCSSGCGSGCSTNCTTSCSGHCEEKCTGTCKGGCINKCAGTCGATCVAQCNLQCGAGCSRSCGANCASTCSNDCMSDCDNNCWGGCHVVCKTGCGNQCNGSCYSTCSEFCNKECNYWCNVACTAWCESNCGTGCNSKCGADCTIRCDHGCIAACSASCNQSCASSCSNACRDACSLNCRLDCYLACHTTCTYNCKADCYDACKGNCYSDCNAGCSVGCNTSCRNGCSTGCSATCGKSCSTTAMAIA